MSNTAFLFGIYLLLWVLVGVTVYLLVYLLIWIHDNYIVIRTRSVVIYRIAGNIVEDAHGDLWEITNLDRYTLLRLQARDRLEVRCKRSIRKKQPVKVIVQNINSLHPSTT